MATLKRCYVTFGIPSYATKEPWEGKHILVSLVIIRVKAPIYKAYKKSKSSPVGAAEYTPTFMTEYKAVQEHRNSPIGASYAIYLNLPFTKPEMKRITRENIVEIELHLAAYLGKDESPSICRFRTEVVLEFTDGKISATGYNDPAYYLSISHRPVEDPANVVFKVAKYYNKPTLSEPIG